jgi:hypothetical protein
LRDLGGHGGQVGVERFFKQALSLDGERFGLRSELQPLERGVLVGEFVDQGLFVRQLARGADRET